MNYKKAVLEFYAPDGQEFSEKGAIVNQSDALNGVCVEIYLPTRQIKPVGSLQYLMDRSEADKKAYPLTWWKAWEWRNKNTQVWFTPNYSEFSVRNDFCDYRRHQHAEIIMRTEQDKIDYPDFWNDLYQWKNSDNEWCGFGKNWIQSQFKSEFEYRQHPHRERIIAWHGCSDEDKGRWQYRVTDKCSWNDCFDYIGWYEEREYRLRPRTCSVKVGDKVWEFPEPVRDVLEDWQRYWYVYADYVAEHAWTNDSDICKRALALGLIHLTQQAAEQHLAALQAVNGQVAL